MTDLCDKCEGQTAILTCCDRNLCRRCYNEHEKCNKTSNHNIRKAQDEIRKSISEAKIRVDNIMNDNEHDMIDDTFNEMQNRIKTLEKINEVTSNENESLKNRITQLDELNNQKDIEIDELTNKFNELTNELTKIKENNDKEPSYHTHLPDPTIEEKKELQREPLKHIEDEALLLKSEHIPDLIMTKISDPKAIPITTLITKKPVLKRSSMVKPKEQSNLLSKVTNTIKKKL